MLIVDDSAYVRQALCELFKREADFKVCGEAENGKDAIKKAQELRPDLIVLDLSMPVMNGFDADVDDIPTLYNGIYAALDSIGAIGPVT